MYLPSSLAARGYSPLLAVASTKLVYAREAKRLSPRSNPFRAASNSAARKNRAETHSKLIDFSPCSRFWHIPYKNIIYRIYKNGTT